YMIETRWLLSAIVRYSTYRCVSGSGLLLERGSVRGGRLEAPHLAKEMHREWNELFEASAQAIKEHRDGLPDMCEEPDKIAFHDAIKSLRNALGLHDRYDGDEFHPKGDTKLHAIGYSLGGFT